MGRSGLEQVQDGWFRERVALWPGQQLGLEVKKVLHHDGGGLQDILVFESATYGTVLALDGIIQVTERDEFAYQEMLAHVGLFAHSAPERVLVVGGGDGGIVREVLRHASVREVVLCEIDARVVDVSRRFLPTLAAALDDPRVTVLHRDGAGFMRECEGKFDVIVTDSSDPVGPAEVLFKEPYYRAVHSALCEGGVAVAQGECIWLHLELIKPMLTTCRGIFADVEYGYTTIPTYPSGQIGFVVCSKSDKGCSKEPCREVPDELQKALKYYNKDIHSAAFVLPEFAKRALE